MGTWNITEKASLARLSFCLFLLHWIIITRLNENAKAMFAFNEGGMVMLALLHCTGGYLYFIDRCVLTLLDVRRMIILRSPPCPNSIPWQRIN